MTLILAVGGISAAHAVARSRGASLIHVRTHDTHTMLPVDEYVDVIDLGAVSPEYAIRVAYVAERLPKPAPTAILCLHDEAVVFGAHLAEFLGLPFASVSTAEATVDKARMRERLNGTDLGTVGYGTVSGGQIHWRTTRPTGPVVLKPAHGRASIGVRMLPDASTADQLVARAPDEFCDYVVEEHKFGAEFSVESIVTASGQWHGVTAKHTREAIEVGHVHPAPLIDVAEATVKDTAVRAIHSLGVSRGLLHTEIILDKDGVAHVVETHLRGGGDHILDLVRLATGLDLTAMYVDDVLGSSPMWPPVAMHGFASSQYSIPEVTGTVVGWEGLESAGRRLGVVDIGTLPDVGDRIGDGPKSNYARLVWAIATGSDPEMAVQRARDAAYAVSPRLAQEAR